MCSCATRYQDSSIINISLIISILDLLHRNSYQTKMRFKNTTVGWVWLGMPSRTQLCLDLPGQVCSI